MKNKNKIKPIFRRFIMGWIELAQGITTILTLGIISIDWDYNYAYICSRKDAKLAQKERENI